MQLTDRILDLALVGLNIHDENQGIGVLDELHRTFRCEGVFDEGEFVQRILLRCTLAGIFGLARCYQSLGSVEVYLGTDFRRLLRYLALR